MTKKLYKSVKDRKLTGVCGGIAEYFNIDSSIIRIVWIALVFLQEQECWLILFVP